MKYLWQQTQQVDTTQLIGDSAASISAEAQAAYPALNNGSLADYNGRTGFAGGGFSGGKNVITQQSQMQTTQEVGDKSTISAEAERSFKNFQDLT